jgi:hypothetical protein
LRLRPHTDLPGEGLEVPEPVLGSVETTLDIDAGVTMGDDVPQTDGSLQGKGGPAIEDTKLLETRKALGERGGRRPTLVRNQVACQVSTHLNGQHQVERNQVERVSAGPEGLGALRHVCSDALYSVVKLHELRCEQIAVNHG